MADTSLVGMDEASLEQMTVVQLREHLKKRNLSSAGNKPILVQRLAEYIQKAENQILGAVDGSGSSLSEEAVLGLAPSESGENAHPAPASEPATQAAPAIKPLDRKPVQITASSPTATTKTTKSTHVPITMSDVNSDATGKTAGGAPSKIALRGPPGSGSAADVPAPVSVPLDEQKKMARAKKFGTELDVGSRAVLRAERFGLPANTAPSGAVGTDKPPVDSDKLKKRAERFGAVSAAETNIVDEKLAARNARFNSGELANKGTVPLKIVASPPADDLLSKRRERFGDAAKAPAPAPEAKIGATIGAGKITGGVEDGVETKKARRAERFNASLASTA